MRAFSEGGLRDKATSHQPAARPTGYLHNRVSSNRQQHPDQHEAQVTNPDIQR